jgi:hypothetical protein
MVLDEGDDGMENEAELRPSFREVTWLKSAGYTTPYNGSLAQ